MTKSNVIPAETPARFIAVTEHYGLVPDDTCFVLYRKVTVDPRRSPNYKDDGGPVIFREVWRDQKRYYNLSPAGLRNALRGIAVMEAAVVTGGQTDIGRFIAAIDSYVTRLERLVSEVSVNE